MFKFALVFLAAHRHFSLQFQTFSAFRGKRKKEFGRNHSQRKPLTTTTTCIRRKVLNWSLCLLCSMLFIFSERKCISKSWIKLMNYKLPENRIPWLLTDFDNIKDFPWLLKKFPDFSLTLKNFRFPWLFPDIFQSGTFSQRSGAFSAIFARLRAMVFGSKPPLITFVARTGWGLGSIDAVNYRIVRSRYHGSKILGPQQLFMTETAICIVELWKKSMGYHFDPECNHA